MHERYGLDGGAAGSALADDVERLALAFEHGFLGDVSLTLRVEEELVLLDRQSLLPADKVEHVLSALPFDGRFQAEFRASQLEVVTPVCLTAGDAFREISAARAYIVQHLEGRLRLAAVGTHPISTRPSAITPRERFKGIARDCAWATRRGQPSGLHVHVGMSDPGEALAVYNTVRSYLPELAALAINSPFFEGRDSGLASARLKLTEDLPRSGIPPAFAGWRDLARFTAWGARGGLFPDPTYLWWDLRLRPDYGTLEFRIADVQTRPQETATLIAVSQALVADLSTRLRQGERLTVHETYAIAENRWRAVRDGLDGELVDLETGEIRSTRERLGELLVQLEPVAAELGCSGELAHGWTLLEENGAARQRRFASRAGIDELLLRLVDETELRDEQTTPEPELVCS